MYLKMAVCALLASALAGCGAGSLGDRETTARSHLTEQGQYLIAAMQHLAQARSRLQSEPDPGNAAVEVAAGYSQLQLASVTQQKIVQDVRDLGGAATSLQHQIDSERNDLLGPRGHRIVHRVILLAILACIGWGLLRLGPIFGGPVGGGVIVAGHILTAFAIPLFHGVVALAIVSWRGLVVAAGWAAQKLDKLAGSKIGSTSVSIPRPQS